MDGLEPSSATGKWVEVSTKKKKKGTISNYIY